MLDRLTETHPVWLLLGVSEEEASCVLLKQPAGVRGHHPLIHLCLLQNKTQRGFYIWFVLCPGAGVSGQEVAGSAEEGSFCSPGGGSIRNSHHPLPRQRDSVL